MGEDEDDDEQDEADEADDDEEEQDDDEEEQDEAGEDAGDADTLAGYSSCNSSRRIFGPPVCTISCSAGSLSGWPQPWIKSRMIGAALSMDSDTALDSRKCRPVRGIGGLGSGHDDDDDDDNDEDDEEDDDKIVFNTEML